MSASTTSGFVRDYMNGEVLYLRVGNRVEIALRPILDFGLTAVPVLDDDERPVGVVSLRDIVEERHAPRSLKKRLRTIMVDESMDRAAQMVADEDVHHLVVVDASGKTVGMLSTLDVVRALTGRPPKHVAASTQKTAIGDEDEVDRTRP